MREGQFIDEIPTSKYFSHKTNSNLLSRRQKGPIFHHVTPHIKPSSSHVSRGRFLTNQEQSHESRAKLLTNHGPSEYETPITYQQVGKGLQKSLLGQKWLKENDFKLSDFGLSEDAHSALDDVPVYPVDGSVEGALTKSYSNNLLSSLGVNEPQMSSLATPKQINAAVSSNKRHHAKKLDSTTNKHLEKILNLISLVKDFSHTYDQERKLASTLHHQRHLMVPELRPPEVITSSEHVAEEETAASDSEAKWKGDVIQNAAKLKINNAYHKSLKTAPILDPDLHHLVTVDTTTGEIFNERTLPREALAKFGLGSSPVIKKTSMGYVPKKVKRKTTVSKGTRRAHVIVTKPTPRILRNITNRRKTSLRAKAARKLTSRNEMMTEIRKDLSFVDDKQLLKLENTLESIKRLKKIH
eukprot:TCONS_00007258-protein